MDSPSRRSSLSEMELKRNDQTELMDDAGGRAVMAEAARKKASRHALGIVKKEWYGLLNVDGGVE